MMLYIKRATGQVQDSRRIGWISRFFSPPFGPCDGPCDGSF